MVEAFAVIRAVEFAVHMGFAYVEVDGGALGIITKLQNRDMDLSAIGTIIDEARSIMEHFTNYKIMHSRRTGNEAAG